MSALPLNRDHDIVKQLALARVVSRIEVMFSMVFPLLIIGLFHFTIFSHPLSFRSGHCCNEFDSWPVLKKLGGTKWCDRQILTLTFH